MLHCSEAVFVFVFVFAFSFRLLPFTCIREQRAARSVQLYSVFPRCLVASFPRCLAFPRANYDFFYIDQQYYLNL